MITLPFSCREAKICLKLTGLGLLVTSIIHGILYDNIVTFVVGGVFLFIITLVSLVWYGYGIEQFFQRHIRCKCDGN